MAKKNYKALLADGTELTRGTERTYTHAWAIYHEGQLTRHIGFSGSKELAEKAARACMPTDMEAEHKRAMRKNPNLAKYLREHLAKNFGGSWETYRAQHAARLASIRIEIIPCHQI